MGVRVIAQPGTGKRRTVWKKSVSRYGSICVYDENGNLEKNWAGYAWEVKADNYRNLEVRVKLAK